MTADTGDSESHCGCILQYPFMAKSDLKLLGLYVSPFVLRVKIALKIKSLDYEYLEEQMPYGKSDLLLQSNPIYKKVPVLLHHDKPICESLIIVQYIDEVWASGPSILPSDPYDRALARIWAAYVDDKLLGPMVAILKANGEEERKPHVAQLEEVLVTLEDAFRKCSNGKAFFGGDSIGYLDIACGSMLYLLKTVEKMNGLKLLDESKHTLLAEWAERFSGDEAVNGLTPEIETLVEFANRVFRPQGNRLPINGSHSCHFCGVSDWIQ